MAKERLDKIIASAGSFSRKEVKHLIREGRVMATGRIAQKPEEKYDPETDEILVDHSPIHYVRFHYLMMYKPAGVITAVTDSREKTVMDLLPSEYRHQNLFPVGRLDKDTEGLLLITDNGQLAHDLLSPGKHVDKCYFVRVNDTIPSNVVQTFAEGITLSDGYHCLPAVLSLQDTPNEAIITIREGKYHQIKRMFLSIGLTVIYLKRLQMGSVCLDPDLAPGKCRELTQEEIAALFQEKGVENE